MKNVAALINDLSMSQKSFYLIKEFNKMIDDTSVSVGVFCNRQAIPPIQPLFGCKLASFLVSYNGILISTTLAEAESSLKLPNKSDRYLYLWDLEWLERSVDFDKAVEILRDEKLKVIARSKAHAQIIESFANIKVCGIVSDWNMSQLQKII